jgi:hypothetical protein
VLPNQILGIPIIEEAAPRNLAAEKEHELYSQLQVAIEMLRCPSCGSLNYQTTLFVFSTGIEKMVECRNCGNVHEEVLDDNAIGHLGFLSHYIAQGDAICE